MDRSGIDLAAIEYHIAYQHYDETQHPESVRVEISKFINNRLAEVSQKYSERFFMMADIPLLNIDEAIKELNRSCELGSRGLCLNTHINGTPLISDEFQPFWKEVDQLGLPVFLHPRSDLKQQRLSQYVYTAILGYAFDTTIAGLDFLVDRFFNGKPFIWIWRH